MLKVFTIVIVLICLGSVILFLTRGKKKYVFMLNFGVAILPFLIPFLIDVIKILMGMQKNFSDPILFVYLNIVGQVFFITLAVIALLIFPFLITLVSSGIYRSISLPKKSKY